LDWKTFDICWCCLLDWKMFDIGWCWLLDWKMFHICWYRCLNWKMFDIYWYWTGTLYVFSKHTSITNTPLPVQQRYQPIADISPSILHQYQQKSSVFNFNTINTYNVPGHSLLFILVRYLMTIYCMLVKRA
jgi:hypothetical protein